VDIIEPKGATVYILELQERIRRSFARGASIDQLEEDVIAPARLSDDQKAALWLFAWSFLSRHAQRAEANRLAYDVSQ
jgi:hypothetical protein